MNWIYMGGLFDTLDLVVIFSIITGAIWFYFKSRPKSSFTSVNKYASVVSSSSSAALQKTDKSFLGRMKSEERQVLILFGSQTGTAEELAGRLAKDLVRYGKKALVMDPEEIEVEDLPKITEITDSILILCVATYGEGDPTDNANALYEFFVNNDSDLKGLHYAVFGLGNKTYEHFNEVGIFFDKRLEELGAKRAYEIGLADDDGNLEEDFMRWREHFLPTLAEKFTWQLSNNGKLDRQYRLDILTEAPANIFTGEFGRIGAFERQRPPFDQKNPYLSQIAINRELHTDKSGRSCRHIEFNVESKSSSTDVSPIAATSRAVLRYETGDHIGIFPTNDRTLVTQLGELLNEDLNTVFKLINLDEESSKRHPFPCPCTYRTALTHYVDIHAPVKSHVLKALAEFTEDEEMKAKLTHLSTASEEGLREYHTFIVKERRNIVDLLKHFSQCKPPIDVLLELLPRLQARYYSISSSPKMDSNHVSVTAIVLNYKIGDRTVKGVCTNFLADLDVGASVPVFIRKSTLRLPHRTQTPVIMIGPGTGLAPFRGFLQERLWYKKQGKEVGEMVLFFGCRHPEQDYIYKTELEELVLAGLLTELHLAFSRQQSHKVYVQHKLWENRDRVWELIQANASIYVCGDARNMARDVQNILLKIFKEVGGQGEVEAQKLMKDLERQRRYQADVWS